MDIQGLGRVPQHSFGPFLGLSEKKIIINDFLKNENKSKPCKVLGNLDHCLDCSQIVVQCHTHFLAALCFLFFVHYV